LRWAAYLPTFGIVQEFKSMPVVLQILGSLIGAAGLVMVGIGLPIRYASLDNTLIAAGVVAIVGGLILIGLGSALRELRKLTRTLERTGVPAALPVEPESRPARSPRVTGPLPVPGQKPGRAEPRIDPAIAEEPVEQDYEPEPEPEPAGSGARQRPSIFALVRGSRTEHFEIDETEGVPLSPTIPRAPSAMPERVAQAEEPAFSGPRFAEPRVEPRAESRAEQRPEPRISSPAALASRTAARIDMPRQVPELPRASERSGRNLFDSVWPNEEKRAPSFERAQPERPAPDIRPGRPLFVPEPEPEPEPEQSRDAGDLAHAAVKEAIESLSLNLGGEPSPQRQEPKLDLRADARPDPKPITILKSGVIDGMAYTLYTDGSIEAQLPTGLMRFSSIDDLRTYLERSSGS
jgi:hypothetical protein